MSDYEKVDFKNGKIYKIISNDCDLVYIGSTAKYKLEDRMAGHVMDFNRGHYVSSCELIKQPHYDIIELQAYPCNSKTALTAQERFWILKYRDDGINVVNILIPSGIEADNEADWQRQYYQDNKEKIAARAKQNYQDNKDKILEKKKQNYQDNKEELLEKRKQYQQDNKQKIKEKSAAKVTCDCGCEVTKQHLTRHQKTKRHLSMMSTM